MSNVIVMLSKQVVLRRGIPFDMKLPPARPVAIGGMTREQIDAEIQKGMDDIAAGRVISADEVKAEMRRLYGQLKIVYTSQAQQDLKNIYEYIRYSLLAPDTARKMYNKIISCARSLETMPERNPLYKEEPWYSQGVRFAAMQNYLLLYMVKMNTETVSVVRILYRGMGISRYLKSLIFQAF